MNGQSISTDVVDRPKTDVVGKMWYVIWGYHMETKVLTSWSSSIFYLLTYFLPGDTSEQIYASDWGIWEGVHGGHINPINYIWFCLIYGI